MLRSVGWLTSGMLRSVGWLTSGMLRSVGWLTSQKTTEFKTDVHLWQYLAKFIYSEKYLKKFVEKVKYIFYIYFFFGNSCQLWVNVEKYCRVGQATNDNIIRRMRFDYSAQYGFRYTDFLQTGIYCCHEIEEIAAEFHAYRIRSVRFAGINLFMPWFELDSRRTYLHKTHACQTRVYRIVSSEFRESLTEILVLDAKSRTGGDRINLTPQKILFFFIS